MVTTPARLGTNVPRLLLLLTLCAGLAACQPGKGNAVEQNTDWKSLEFTCTKEQNPPLDKEADHWFKSARAIEKGERSGTNAQMIDLYEKAAAKDHFKAIINLANIYGSGEGVEPDERRAVSLLEHGMRMNVPSAYYNMGTFLQQGIGVKQDRVAALAYFRKAADMGSPDGQYAVGDKLMAEFSASPDKDKVLPIAISMLECSLGQGFSKAGMRLGSHFSGVGYVTNKERGLPYFQKAAALGDDQAIYMLQTAFEEGEYGLTKDPARAACYKRLWNEIKADKTKKFPNIDRICPLPPKPLP